MGMRGGPTAPNKGRAVIVESSTPASPRVPPTAPNTRPSWLIARVRYQCDLIDLCAREVEARGQLTSDVPERATAALRRWCEGSDAPGDRASWALEIEKDPKGVPVVDPRTVTGELMAMVRETVRTRVEGERAVRDGRASFAPIKSPIGNRGECAAWSAIHLLRRVGILDVQALHMVAPSYEIARDDSVQQQAHERERMNVAIDWIRTTIGGAPTEAQTRAACAKYEVTEALTADLVRLYSGRPTVDPLSISEPA